MTVTIVLEITGHDLSFFFAVTNVSNIYLYLMNRKLTKAIFICVHAQADPLLTDLGQKLIQVYNLGVRIMYQIL